ncbi:MAG: tetratricopeptide repeat protein, partial [Desulfobulbales bacterium]
HLTILSRNEDGELDVLAKTAETYAHLGDEQQAAIYWERVLGRDPENTEAHLFLARHYEKVEELDRSITHMEAIIDHDPEDAAAYASLGELYARAGEYAEAAANYNKSLALHPGDNRVEQRLAAVENTLAQVGSDREASTGLYAVEARERVRKLKDVIRKLEADGRYRDTIPPYRQLFGLAPEDHETMASLARDLIAISEGQGMDSMLSFLTDIAADDKTIYRSVSELLRQQGHDDVLQSVLAATLKRYPAYTYVMQELAILYLNKGELPLSRKYFAELGESGCTSMRCLEAKAALDVKLDLPAHRLQAYETLLQLQPDREDIRVATVALAAQMGLLDKAVFYAGYLKIFPPSHENLEVKLLLAEAYRVSGYLSRAMERYRAILEQTAGNSEATTGSLRTRSWLGIADSYEKLGLVYEAEQALREALSREQNRTPLLEKLFHLYLRTDRVNESEVWLKALTLDTAASKAESGARVNDAWKHDYFEAQKFNAAGDYLMAADHFRRAAALVHYASDSGAGDTGGAAAHRLLIQTGLAASLMYAGKYAEAEDVVLGQQKNNGRATELLVLLEQIYRAWGRDAKAEKIAAETAEYAAQDFGRQLKLANLYRKYNNSLEQFAALAETTTDWPDSLAVKLLLVDARMQQGEHFAALELLDQFLRSYPENTWFLSQKAVLLASVGRFQEALSEAELILAENPARRDIVLLQARVLWEMKRWNESVARYASMTDPPVADLLEQKLQDRRLVVDQPPPKSSWWKTITFSDGTPLTVVQIIMSPQHVVDFSENGQAINAVAAPEYAFYRWQDRFSKELSVRQHVMRREYYHAAGQLENVIEEFGADDFLLYDLAGLYSKLERLQDEADIYLQLTTRNNDFPGLAEAEQRNNLKRRPKIFLAYRMLDDDGWGGYKAIRQERYTAGGRYYLTTNQEWNIDITRTYYNSTRDQQRLLSWRTMLAYDAKLSQELSLALAGGVEKMESGYSNFPVWSGAVTGKVADEVRAVFSIKQDVVADTIASLKRNINRRDYKIELMLDLIPNILLGGNYDFIDFSDRNWTNNYTFWASGILIPEPHLLKITYNYDFYNSREGQIHGAPAEDGFAPDDHPYWSPQNYWITRFSFYFKHQLSNDALARGVPSYYTVEYSIGYDSDDNDLHELKGGLNFEIAKKYILSASYGYMNLDAYKHEELFLSLTYRF